MGKQMGRMIEIMGLIDQYLTAEKKEEPAVSDALHALQQAISDLENAESLLHAIIDALERAIGKLETSKTQAEDDQWMWCNLRGAWGLVGSLPGLVIAEVISHKDCEDRLIPALEREFNKRMGEVKDFQASFADISARNKALETTVKDKNIQLADIKAQLVGTVLPEAKAINDMYDYPPALLETLLASANKLVKTCG